MESYESLCERLFGEIEEAIHRRHENPDKIEVTREELMILKNGSHPVHGHLSGCPSGGYRFAGIPLKVVPSNQKET